MSLFFTKTVWYAYWFLFEKFQKYVTMIHVFAVLVAEYIYAADSIFFSLVLPPFVCLYIYLFIYLCSSVCLSLSFCLT